MSATIIDGKAAAGKIRDDAKLRAGLLSRDGVRPCLAVIIAGEDPASLSYVAAKGKALAEAGMESLDIRLPENVDEARLLEIIAGLNADEKVHGILVQLPLPAQVDEDRIITAIDPAKDVDGFHPVSVGNMVLGRPGFLPCTPNGILALLGGLPVPLSGKHAVVVGRSNIVGKPLANLLARREANATVTICHTGTVDLASHTLRADILIAAVGKAGIIGADMVRPGAIVIDVGVNRVADPSAPKGYRLRGDVDFPEVAKKAGYLTPVPGGVGPMTIAMLLGNVVQAAERSRRRPLE
jgi:methylenetetrahydrofolate dehydrogenase (NADP+)/methenyltetrahydrofolate cyclohydrolase